MPAVATNSRVFVTQEMNKLNYLPAQKFGEITFLTRDEFSSVRTSLGNKELIANVYDKLKDFNPEVDYIVFSGSPTVAAAVFAILGKMTTHFTILRWSNRDSFYAPVTIDISKEHNG